MNDLFKKTQANSKASIIRQQTTLKSPILCFTKKWKTDISYSSQRTFLL